MSRPLIIACIVSIAVHAMLFANVQFDMPAREKRASRIMEARLVPMKTIQPVIEPAKSSEKIVPRPKKPKHPVQQAQPKPIETDQDAAPPAQAEMPPIAEEAQSEAPPIPAETADVGLPVNKRVPSEVSRTISLPNQLVIRFSVNWGADGMGVGRTEYRWQREGKRYNLQSFTESTGIIDLFKSVRLLQTSVGEITENGLRPEAFMIQRGAKPSESAAFNWSTQSLKLTNGDESQTVPLLPGTQDLMSVLFQFAFVPPAGEALELAVVTGRKLDSYRFSIVGEEALQLPIGKVRTLHVRRRKTETDDGLDVWLAIEHHHLPVRILRSDRKDSRPIELVAVEILVADEEDQEGHHTEN